MSPASHATDLGLKHFRRGNCGRAGGRFQRLCCHRTLQFSVPEPRQHVGTGCSAKSVFRDLWLLSVPNSRPPVGRDISALTLTVWASAHSKGASLHVSWNTHVFYKKARGLQAGLPHCLNVCSPPLPLGPPTPIPTLSPLSLVAGHSSHSRQPGIAFVGSPVEPSYLSRIHMHPEARGPQAHLGQHWPAASPTPEPQKLSEVVWSLTVRFSLLHARDGTGPNASGCQCLLPSPQRPWVRQPQTHTPLPELTS